MLQTVFSPQTVDAGDAVTTDTQGALVFGSTGVPGGAYPLSVNASGVLQVAFPAAQSISNAAFNVDNFPAVQSISPSAFNVANFPATQSISNAAFNVANLPATYSISNQVFNVQNFPVTQSISNSAFNIANQPQVFNYAQSRPAITTASSLVLAQGTRRRVDVCNNSQSMAFLNFATVAVSGQGVPLSPGAHKTFYTLQSIYAVATGNINLDCYEIT